MAHTLFSQTFEDSRPEGKLRLFSQTGTHTAFPDWHSLYTEYASCSDCATLILLIATTLYPDGSFRRPHLSLVREKVFEEPFSCLLEISKYVLRAFLYKCLEDIDLHFSHCPPPHSFGTLPLIQRPGSLVIRKVVEELPRQLIVFCLQYCDFCLSLLNTLPFSGYQIVIDQLDAGVGASEASLVSFTLLLMLFM